jgi:hypothetical protein
MASAADVQETATALAELAAAKMETGEVSVEGVAPPVEAVAGDAPQVEEAAPEPMAFRPTIPTEESKEFAELARRERGVREQTEQNKAMERELAELRGEIRGSKGINEVDLREQARQDPLAFIKKYGLSYDDLTNTVLNGEKAPPDLELRHEISQLRNEMASIKDAKIKEAEEQKTTSEAQAYDKFIDEVHGFVENNSDEYELVRLQGAQQLVGDVIRETYNATQRVLPYKEACQIVEDHLEQQVRNSMRSRKLRAAAPPIESVTPAAESKVPPRPKTLTNENTASPASLPDPNSSAFASRDDSLEQLASTLNFWGTSA